MDDTYMDKWNKIKIEVQNVLQGSSSHNLIVKAYVLACAFIKNNHGERLGNDMKEVLMQHLESQVSQS
jgi:hypothetical protein